MSLSNLVSRVLRLFGQRLVARRDSGELKFYYWPIKKKKNNFSNSPVSPGQKSLRTLGTRFAEAYCLILWTGVSLASCKMAVGPEYLTRSAKIIEREVERAREKVVVGLISRLCA